APTSAYENDELAIQVFNQDATILDATAGQNSGDTALAINQFSLSVPANTNKVAEQYTTILNWTFSFSPTN
ncbi:MAG: WxL domain-containing protein, partial [Enterococcus hirae]|nr:WxL domain-containing protein [Enterococcus hirae]